MNGGRLVLRSLFGASLLGASALGALLFTGTAYGHDQTTAVECIDSATGAWRASMAFSSVDVTEGHTAIVHFGSASTPVGPDGTATLFQDFGGDQATATVTWSIERNGAVDRSGAETFSKPEGCVQVTTTTAPPTTTPQTTTIAKSTPTTAAPAPTPPPPAPTTPQPPRHVESLDLPVTGAATTVTGVVAVLAIVTGGVIVHLTRRRPEGLIGDQ
jgi:hypothetical protein